MIIVGLTGGIASGKSTVAEIFRREGGHIIDADFISREVVKPGESAWQEVVNFFGPEVLHEDRTIDRKKLGEVVFSDPEKRKKLEEIIHPKIQKERQRKINEIEKRGDHQEVVILDVPLLFELNKQGTVEKVVLVYVAPQVQMQRLMKRDGLTEEEARKRIDSQMPIASKKKHAHYVINNEGSFEQTEAQAKEVFRKLKEVETAKRLRV